MTEFTHPSEVWQAMLALDVEPFDEREYFRLKEIWQAFYKHKSYWKSTGKTSPVNQPPRPLCVHLGKQIGKVKVACTGCGGKPAGVMHTYYDCAIHGRCLPFFRGPWGEAQQDFEAKLYQLCQGCDEKELADAP